MSQNQVAQAQVLVANIEIFTQILKNPLNILVAKLGYQQPKSGSPSKFQVAWGYWATTKSYTVYSCYVCTTVTTSHKLKLLLLTNSKAESDCYAMTYNTVL